MSIQIPADELLRVASTLQTRAASAMRDARSRASAADAASDGIIHQGAASKVEAVAQKLGTSLELGEAAVNGLASGLVDVVHRFGALDRAATQTPDLGPGNGPR